MTHPSDRETALTESHEKAVEDVLRELVDRTPRGASKLLSEATRRLRIEGWADPVIVRGKGELETLEIWAVPEEDSDG